jgi:hypothetical protein
METSKKGDTNMNKEELDVVLEVYQHRALVKTKMTILAEDIMRRGRMHDNSKTGGTELAALVTGKTELAKEIHEATNDHHVAHFTENGIEDMNLCQLMELICDCMTHYEATHTEYDLKDMTFYTLQTILDGMRLEYHVPGVLYGMVENTIKFIVEQRRRNYGGVVSGESKEE